MTPPTSEHGTPAKKSKPAADIASMKRTAASDALTGAASRARDGPSSRQLGPGAAVVVEAVDVHPSLVHVDRGDRAAAIDDRLEQMGDGGALEGLGPLDPKLPVRVAHEPRAGRGEGREADELAVRVRGRHLGTDAQHAAAL